MKLASKLLATTDSCGVCPRKQTGYTRESQDLLHTPIMCGLHPEETAICRHFASRKYSSKHLGDLFLLLSPLVLYLHRIRVHIKYFGPVSSPIHRIVG